MVEQSSDRELDEEVVSGLVAVQFPQLASGEVSGLGHGWDHELFSVGAEWIFRFPKRAERVPWLLRETEILAVLAESVGPLVPCFEWLGRPSETFPYPFVGYRRLPGMPADQIETNHSVALAKDIGRLLNTLHSVDPRRIPPTPSGWEPEPWAHIRTRLVAVAEVVRPLLAGDLLAEAEPYLAGSVGEPRRDGPRRFIHNDICPDHLIVDPHTGRLSGLVDFTDAIVGEPVQDFVGLVGLGGRRFIDQVAAFYELPLGDGFDAQLEWLSRVLTLTWLAEAATQDLDGVPKHLSWVAYAFDT